MQGQGPHQVQQGLQGGSHHRSSSPAASKALSHPWRGGPSARPRVEGQVKVGRAVLQAQALLDGGTELGQSCAPKPSPSGPPAWVCKISLFSCGNETAPRPCAQVIMALDFCCLTLLLCHIQAAPKLPSKLCQTIATFTEIHQSKTSIFCP